MNGGYRSGPGKGEAEILMDSSETSRDVVTPDAVIAACPLSSPLAARIPGLLALAAIPAAILVNPFFFGLAGGLLASISLLLAPVGCRCLGVVGLVGAVAGAMLAAFVPL
jgi:hypothetical protein